MVQVHNFQGGFVQRVGVEVGKGVGGNFEEEDGEGMGGFGKKRVE